MTMTHRERLETAWRHEEPDRVPIELSIAPGALEHPRAQRLRELVDEHADNFLGITGPDFGFLGLPTEYTEEVVEDRPGEYKRMRRTHRTAAGDFTAITWHPAHSNDYHWEKRFISTVDDFRRAVDTPRAPAPWDRERHLREVADVGERGIPTMTLPIPLGRLVRWTTHEEVYA
ncbi:MAG TPA: hypothetical protein VMX57_03600, partial [Planctomycetota bacterium]|nr:hypothetical protein [Planctomycetota bacterium]